METKTFGLSWKSFQTHILSALAQQFKYSTFSDVTLVTDDHSQFQAHKFVLSACSPILENILLTNPHQHPFLFLYGVKKKELECILQFMYLGETKIDHERIDDFLKVATDLKIKQLCQENIFHEDELIDYEIERKVSESKSVQDAKDSVTEVAESHIEIIHGETLINDLRQTKDRFASEGPIVTLKTSLNCSEQQSTQIPPVVRDEDSNKCHNFNQTSIATTNKTEQEITPKAKKYKTFDMNEYISPITNTPNHVERNQSRVPNYHQAKIDKLKDFELEKGKFKLSENSSKLSSSSKEVYKCNKCRSVFKTKEGFTFHSHKNHNDMKNFCDQCGFEPKDKGHLKRHYIAKHNSLNIKCDQCHYIATTHYNFKQHQKVKHQGIVYTCDECDYSATHRSSIVRHKQSKHEGIRHQCDKCDFQAAQIFDLKIHSRTIHGGLSFSCDKCEYGAISKKTMRKHIKTKHKELL